MNLTTTPLFQISKISILLVLLILSTTNVNGSEDKYEYSEMPNWVENAAVSMDRQLPFTQPSQYFLIDYQINLVGEVVQFRRTIAKPLTTAGVSQLSELKFPFNPLYQKLKLHKLTVTRGDDKRDVLKSSEIRVVQQENQLQNDIITGINTAIVLLEDIRVNDVIEYAISIEGVNPVFGEKRFGHLGLNWQISADRLQVRIITDPTRPLQTKLHNLDKEVKILRKSSQLEYIYEKENTEAITVEGEYPPWYKPFASLEYSEYETWEEVNDWAKSLFEIDNNFEPEFREIVSNFEQENLLDYAANALGFVQSEIRYLGLEIGVNSHLPHHPNEVIKTRYGDCKDKTLLLSSILAEKNIKSYPALVSARHRKGIKSNLPSPNVFDHAITVIEVDGKQFWVDGTRTNQKGKLEDIGVSDFGYALVVGYPDQGLIKMYEKRPDYGKIEIEEDFYPVDFESPVKYEIKTKYSKNFAEARRFTYQNYSKRQIQQSRKEFLSKFYEEIELVREIEVKDDVEANTFTVIEEYEVSGYWKKDKSKIFSEVKNPGFAGALVVPKTRSRTSPAYIGGPLNIVTTTNIHYPKDTGIRISENDYSIRKWPFEYKYSHSYDTNNNIYTHQSKLNKYGDFVLADGVKNYIEKVNEVWNALSFSISFNDPNTIRKVETPELP